MRVKNKNNVPEYACECQTVCRKHFNYSFIFFFIYLHKCLQDKTVNNIFLLSLATHIFSRPMIYIAVWKVMFLLNQEKNTPENNDTGGRGILNKTYFLCGFATIMSCIRHEVSKTM